MCASSGTPSPAQDHKRVPQRLHGGRSAVDVSYPPPPTGKTITVARDEAIDGAVLVVRLWEQTAASVAIELATRGLPFIVVGGHSPEEIPPAMRGAACMAKPVGRLELVDVASAMFA